MGHFKMKFYGSCSDSEGQHHNFSRGQIIELKKGVSFPAIAADDVSKDFEAEQKTAKKTVKAGKDEVETAAKEPKAEKR